MRRLFHIAVVMVVFTSPLNCLAAADNWPQWRGPNGNGTAAAGDYPLKFSSTENVAWKADVPGRGNSTPVVWGDHIFLTTGLDGQDTVLCYDMAGKELWRKQLGPERAGKHRNGTGANSSPVCDGKNVIVYFKSGTLACFDFAGKEKWKTNLQERFGKDTMWFDMGTSPVLAAGNVVVAVVQEGDSYLVAFRPDTGDVVWKTARKYECPPECDQTYSTPHVAKFDGREVIVTWGADHLTGHDAATGKFLWECGDFNPEKKTHWRTIASTSVSDGMAVVGYGRGEFLVGVRASGEGDITKSARVWEKNGKAQSTDVPTPVTVDGKAYVLNDGGHITCYDIKTGEELWTADLPKNRNKYYASPILAGNKLFCTREDGMIFVGEISDKGFKQLAENDIGEHTIPTPVLVNNGLLVRTDGHLYWIAKQ